MLEGKTRATRPKTDRRNTTSRSRIEKLRCTTCLLEGAQGHVPLALREGSRPTRSRDEVIVDLVAQLKGALVGGRSKNKHLVLVVLTVGLVDQHALDGCPKGAVNAVAQHLMVVDLKNSRDGLLDLAIDVESHALD